MTVQDERRILAKLNPPPAIAKTIETVLQVKESGFDYYGTPIDNAIVWLLQKAGEPPTEVSQR